MFLSDIFNCNLNKNIDLLVNKNRLEKEEGEILREAFEKAGGLFASKLREKLNCLTKKALQDFFYELLEEGREENAVSSLEKFLGFLGEEKLLELAELNRESARQQQKAERLAKVKEQKNLILKKGEDFLNEALPESYYFCHRLMEMIVTITGIQELFEDESQNRYDPTRMMNRFEAETKIQMLLTLIGLPSTTFAFVYGVIGSAAAASAIALGAVVLYLALMAIYIRYLRPCPKLCRGMTNLTAQMRRKEHAPIYKRVDILSHIEEAFKSGRGVILVGEPGTGKSTIAQSLAERIAKQKIGAFLKNAQVFSCTADTVKNTNGASNISFNELEMIFNHHEKKVVFFFDEIHKIFEEDSWMGKSDGSLLTFCNKFPYIITATTEKEYNRFIENNEAFGRRFDKISVGKLNAEEIEVSLIKTFKYLAPALSHDEEAFGYIRDKAVEYKPGTSPIDAAQILLSRAVKEAESPAFQDLQKKIQELKNRVTLLKSKPGCLIEEKNRQKLQKARDKLKKIKAGLEEKKEKVGKIKKLESCLHKRKATSCTLAQKGSPLWFKHAALSKILERSIQNQREAIGLPRSLNKELVDQIIMSRFPY